VGWATVIGCVFGVMLFGILQRGCDAEGTSGVEILAPEPAAVDTAAQPSSRSTRGLSVAPSPAPERAISGPTSPPRGTPQRMQLAAAARANNPGAVQNEETASHLDWLRENRERALQNQRAQRIAKDAADRLRNPTRTAPVS